MGNDGSGSKIRFFRILGSQKIDEIPTLFFGFLRWLYDSYDRIRLKSTRSDHTDAGHDRQTEYFVNLASGCARLPRIRRSDRNIGGGGVWGRVTSISGESGTERPCAPILHNLSWDDRQINNDEF